MMQCREFLSKLNLALSVKTLYVEGCYGAPLTTKAKTTYINKYIKKDMYTEEIASAIKAASSDTFGFDSDGLIKGILWGWQGCAEMKYGGAEYRSNEVPDITADSIIKKCENVSDDMTSIIPGEIVWTEGHIGVYVGNGKVAESCTEGHNGVQLTCLDSTHDTCRKWDKHGFLPWVDYSDACPELAIQTEVADECHTYTVVKGDSLMKIAKKFNTKWHHLATINNIKFPYILKVGQVLKLV